MFIIWLNAKTAELYFKSNQTFYFVQIWFVIRYNLMSIIELIFLEMQAEADPSQQLDRELAAEGDYEKSIQSQLSRKIDVISADNDVSDSDVDEVQNNKEIIRTNSIQGHNRNQSTVEQSKETAELFNPMSMKESKTSIFSLTIFSQVLSQFICLILKSFVWNFSLLNILEL